MNEDLSERDIYIILAFQSAVRDYIFPKLRLVSMTWNNYSSDMYFYIDGQLSDDDGESINLIATYFGIDFPGGGFDECHQHLIRVDSPAPIPVFEGECLYARKENPPIGKVKRGVLTEKQLGRREKVLIALQRAMVGLVFPQVRHVVTDWTETSAYIHFYVDGIISEKDRLSIEQIRQYFLMQFPKEEMTLCDVQVIRIDFPNVPAISVGTSVYSRKEYPSL